MAELVDALVSNTCGKPCRFDSGSGYNKPLRNQGFFYWIWSRFGEVMSEDGRRMTRLLWIGTDFLKNCLIYGDDGVKFLI